MYSPHSGPTSLISSFPSLILLAGAWFVHSTDGGKSWTPDSLTLRGFYALGISMVNPNVGFAAVDNLITQTSSVAKYSEL